MKAFTSHVILTKPFSKEQDGESTPNIQMSEKRFAWKQLFKNKKNEEIAQQREAIRKLEQEAIEREARLAQQERERKAREKARIQQEEQKKWEEDLKRRQLQDRERQKREEKIKKLRLITPETLRELRELIRTRYELDVEIWSLRNVRKPDRGIVQLKMEKADATLQEIHQIVEFWEGTENMWTDAEWEQAMEVRRRVLAEGARWWVGNPPWGED